MSSTMESSYSSKSYTNTKTIRRDQNGNLIRVFRDSSLPPPTRKNKIILESPTSTLPNPPSRKHVSISQSDLQANHPNGNNRIYNNCDHHELVIDNDHRNLNLSPGYRPQSRHLLLNPNQSGTLNSNYDSNISNHYSSQRSNNPSRNKSNHYYHRNLQQGQTLPIKKSPYTNYAFHIPPSNYNRYGSRSSTASYDRFGHRALDRAYPAQTTQAIPDMVTTGEHQYLDDYERDTPRKIMLSEGNLLTAHIEKIRDEGRDNPFKPGTELSWEADLMVRLYKKGHPLSQVPTLLSRIKSELNENKSTSDLEGEVRGLANIDNNEANIMIVGKSKTISNDLCNVAKNSNQQQQNYDKNNCNFINSEKRQNDTKANVVDDGDYIEQIISKLDVETNDITERDNYDRENKENAANLSLEERSHFKVGSKTRLSPAIVNIPKKNNKKKDIDITDKTTEKTKIKKQTSPKMDGGFSDKKREEKSKSKIKKIVSGKKTMEADGIISNADDKAIDVKRHRCCSIQ